MLGNKIMVNKYVQLYPQILRNKQEFEGFLQKIQDNHLNFDERLEYALYALKWATYNHTGYFYSNELERFFIDIAQQNDIDNYCIKPQPKTILHVMTTAYLSGGHTRVVERWVKNVSDEYCSSVVLLKQSGPIPKKLIDNVNTNGGKIIDLKSSDIIQQALKLRKLALKFQYIVLHTHMDDPVATIAFGTEKFQRPVLFYNHADHLFWIGKSIADVVLDLKSITSISKTFRKITQKIMKLPIPAEATPLKKMNPILARSNLGITQDVKIILTSGSAMKFQSICQDDLFDVWNVMLNENKKIYLIAIGVNQYDKKWIYLKKKFNKRITLLKSVPFPEYQKWLSVADVVIDSYPMAGGTALVDAVNTGIPFVSLKTIYGQTDPVHQSAGFCRTKKELLFKVKKILLDKNYAKKILQNEKNCFLKETSPENWKSMFHKILKEIPIIHTIHYPSGRTKNFINDYGATNVWIYRKQLQPKIILNLCYVKLYRKKFGKYKCLILNLFGKEFRFHKKSI